MKPFLTNGTRIYISLLTPATYTLAGYMALTYTQLRGVTSFSDIGIAYETARANLIGFVPHDKKVGIAAQTIQLETVRVVDAGQDMLERVTKLFTSATFKVVSPNGEMTMFTAESSQELKNRGQRDEIGRRKYVLNITSEVLET